MYSITKNGKPLDKSLYTIDEENKIFATKENNLVLDFSGLNGWTFKTGFNCTFKTNSNCIFNTGYDCTFDTNFGCTFNTGSYCTFDTGYNCTFNTGEESVVIRRDEYEVIELKENQTVRLNDFGVKGFTIVEKEELTDMDCCIGCGIKPNTLTSLLQEQREELIEKIAEYTPDLCENSMEFKNYVINLIKNK